MDLYDDLGNYLGSDMSDDEEDVVQQPTAQTNGFDAMAEDDAPLEGLEQDGMDVDGELVLISVTWELRMTSSCRGTFECRRAAVLMLLSRHRPELTLDTATTKSTTRSPAKCTDPASRLWCKRRTLNP